MFVSDELLYIIQRGVIVLNVHALIEDKTDDTRGNLHGELEEVFHKFSNHHMGIILGDFNAKVCREDIFKTAVGNGSSYEMRNCNGIRVVSFTT